MRILQTTCIAFFLCCATCLPVKAETSTSRFGEQLQPILQCVIGQTEPLALTADIDVLVEGKSQHVDGRLVRYNAESFDLDLIHSQYSLRIRRRSNVTALALPHHRVVFIGSGEVDSIDNIAPLGIADRLLGSGSAISIYVQLMQQANAPALSQLVTTILSPKYDEQANAWRMNRDVWLTFADQGERIELNVGDQHQMRLTLHDTVPAAEPAQHWPDFKHVTISRRELELTLARSIRRSLEVLSPSRLLTSPLRKNRKVPGGELRWIDGQRVVMLQGTPEEIGFAHGSLLKDESQRCIDSVLYAFGTANTIRTGRWFRHDLESAYEKLSPYIPDDHKRETAAFASAMEMDPRTVQILNVFPELFHCSGFAVFGNATRDGKLYHGRVLDYMTTIGLQDAATTFIVAVNGKRAFGNIGYAGFIGSVSGMNDQSISLGEMGGGGEGKWDGVPMATLMRRALEECSTLDEVMDLWKRSPRTCEYYYVFADGKAKRAVGVMAVPEFVEFVQPGQTHERLGGGIADAVVLSAGDRLKTLRQRVQQRYGEIDVKVAKWLMSRPVAMQSNLHNVLFVPEDGVFYVANASHSEPAAERPYTKIDLTALLRDMTAGNQPQINDAVK